jgi:hypothetical protein
VLQEFAGVDRSPHHDRRWAGQALPDLVDLRPSTAARRPGRGDSLLELRGPDLIEIGCLILLLSVGCGVTGMPLGVAALLGVLFVVGVASSTAAGELWAEEREKASEGLRRDEENGDASWRT